MPLDLTQAAFFARLAILSEEVHRRGVDVYKEHFPIDDDQLKQLVREAIVVHKTNDAARILVAFLFAWERYQTVANEVAAVIGEVSPQGRIHNL